MKLDPHPLLDLGAFVTRLPGPLEALDLALPDLLARPAPELPDDAKQPVRDLLRHGGFKPSGRNKPASEYVRAAIPSGRLGPINAVVDACNAASFRFGLPISVIDLDLAEGDLRVGIAPEDSRYVFNASGQEIRLDGLLCLFDARGPCANAVKDSQRTKTHSQTRRTLSVIWGTQALPGRTSALLAWYRSALHDAGARTETA